MGPRQTMLERVVATRVLVLRQGADLDSKVIGKLPSGGEAFVLEAKQVGDVMRYLITATAHTAAPLGWITASKGGHSLVAFSPAPRSSQEAKVAREQRFYKNLWALPRRLVKAPPDS